LPETSIQKPPGSYAFNETKLLRAWQVTIDDDDEHNADYPRRNCFAFIKIPESTEAPLEKTYAMGQLEGGSQCAFFENQSKKSKSASTGSSWRPFGNANSSLSKLASQGASDGNRIRPASNWP
jgi:hypothetical protein